MPEIDRKIPDLSFIPDEMQEAVYRVLLIGSTDYVFTAGKIAGIVDSYDVVSISTAQRCLEALHGCGWLEEMDPDRLGRSQFRLAQMDLGDYSRFNEFAGYTEEREDQAIADIINRQQKYIQLMQTANNQTDL